MSKLCRGWINLLSTLFLLLFSFGCDSTPQLTGAPTEPPSQETPTQGFVSPTVQTPKADVLSVSVSGEPGAYRFSVQVSSPDLGCQQYADWWEVVDEAGNLLYRRILAHSHVSEQPFTRSGGPVPIEAGALVWVRAHMNPGGYGGMAMKGSVEAGFLQSELSPDFAPDLAEQPPLPDGCDF